MTGRPGIELAGRLMVAGLVPAGAGLACLVLACPVLACLVRGRPELAVGLVAG